MESVKTDFNSPHCYRVADVRGNYTPRILVAAARNEPERLEYLPLEPTNGRLIRGILAMR
jgi:hypothetical protein